MKTKLLTKSGLLLLSLLIILATSPIKAGATSLTYSLTIDSSCRSYINGAVSTTANVDSGSSSTLTVSNTDLVVSQSVSGPGISAVLQPNDKSSTSSTQTFQLGNVTSQETITFTPIPNNTDPAPKGNNCPSGSSPTASKLIINPVSPPPSSSTPKTTTSTPSTNNKTTSPAQANTVELTAVSVDDKVVQADNIEITLGQSLKLSGHTVAKGIVSLTIHSTPTTATSTADADGNWSYTINGLEIGDHYVDVTVTDPVNQQVSASTKLLSFKVVAPQATAVVTPKPKSNNLGLVVGGLVLGMLIIAMVMLFLRRKRKNVAKQPMKVSDPQDSSAKKSPQTEKSTEKPKE